MTKRTRRSFLEISALAIAGAQVPYSRPMGGGVAGSAPRAKRSLRIAHMTDIHLQPELNAEKWLATCLHSIQELRDKPDFILNGGDAIMDALGASESRTGIQWNLWQKVIKAECSLTIEHCIGNHDIWGWDKKKSGATGAESQYGKKWALDAYGLSARYRSFERGGWHIVVLDSNHSKPSDVYEARLDEEQFTWLERDLESVSPQTPVMVVSHIPILTACGFFHVPASEKTGDWLMLGALMHLDATKLIDLFLKHRNVKLCISGHIHLLDRVEYNGVTYLCNGSVCANWWKGKFHECEPGYALVDLFEDGTFDCEYRTYGWKPQD
jgi:3',5'-cyclic-AMP phosphodiesterase